MVNFLNPARAQVRPMVKFQSKRIVFTVQQPDDAKMLEIALNQPCARFLTNYKKGHFAPIIIHEGLKHWARYGFGPMTLRSLQTGAVLGSVALWHRAQMGETEMGGFLNESFRGRGYAAEARMELRKMATDHYRLPPLISRVSRRNDPAIRLVENLGATYESTTRDRDLGDLQVWRHPDVSSQRR